MAVALVALDASPDGELILPERRRLREVMGPWTPPDQPGGPDAGLLRRAALQVACARRALPAWERLRPADRRPRELIDAIIPALYGEHEEAEIDAAATALEQDVDPLGARADDGPEVMAAFCAGEAAVVLWAHAWDGDLDPDLDPPDTLDRDLDPDVLLVEFLAAAALAFDDEEGKRTFWRWYVTEAFPAAYASVP